MDVRHYKLATSLQARWPGSDLMVSLRPLPTSDVHAAALAAETAPPRARGLRKAAELLAKAITPTATADELLAALGPRELASLTSDWMRAQSRARVEHFDRLGTWVRKSINDHPDVLDDALCAWQAERASDYYGRSMVDLTPAQISWHMLLRAAFKEFYATEPRKRAGRAWLAEDREERLKWQMPD